MLLSAVMRYPQPRATDSLGNFAQLASLPPPAQPNSYKNAPLTAPEAETGSNSFEDAMNSGNKQEDVSLGGPAWGGLAGLSGRLRQRTSSSLLWSLFTAFTVIV